MKNKNFFFLQTGYYTGPIKIVLIYYITSLSFLSNRTEGMCGFTKKISSNIIIGISKNITVLTCQGTRA